MHFLFPLARKLFSSPKRMVATALTVSIAFGGAATGVAYASIPQTASQASAGSKGAAPQWEAETYKVQSFENLVTGETVTLTALCHAGDVVIGGFTQADGVTALSGDERYAAIASIGPAPAAQGWTATATGRTEAPDFLDVNAVCLKKGG